MREIAILLELAGEAALLLWGLHMVQTGVQRAFGARLRDALGRALATRWRAFLAGLAATFALQSSTATALMVAGFAAQGAVGLAPALAAMAGANLGTALLVPVLSLDTGPLAFGLILLGVLGFRHRPTPLLRDLGRVAIGLGLMLLALHLLTRTLGPVEQSPTMRELLALFAGQTFAFVVVAAALAWASHSSLAAVVFAASLAGSGVVSVPDAAAMVVGANVGTALNPLLESGGGPVARRVPLGNFLNRLAGAAAALAMLPWAGPALAALPLPPAAAVALWHVAFNAVTGVLALPLLPALSALLLRWLPEPPASPDPGASRFLDRAALRTPSVALANAQREVLRVLEMIEDRLAGQDGPGAATTGRLQGAIGAYLDTLPAEVLSADEIRRGEELRHFAAVLDATMLALEADLLKPLARLRHPDGTAAAVHEALRAQLRLAVAVIVMDDAAAARRLVEAKEELRDGDPSEAGREVTRGLRVVSGTLAAIAHPLLRRRGELLPSRLAPTA